MSIGKLEKNTVYKKLIEITADHGDDVCYIFPQAKKYDSEEHEESIVTFSELLNDVNTAAKSLLAINLGKDSKISVWSTNTYPFVVLFFAASAIGATTVPLNTNYKENELKFFIEESDSEALFCLSSYRKNDFEAIAKKMSIKNTFIIDNKKDSSLPTWKEFLALSNSISDTQLQDAIFATTPDDIFCLQFTSGTTGRPKGALLSNYSALNVGRQFGDVMNLHHGDILCTSLPLFHCFGNIDVLLSAMTNSVPLVLIDYFSTKKVLSALDKYKCTALYAVPTMFVAIYQDPDFKNYDIKALTKGVVGGSVCIPKVMERIKNEFQMSGIVVGYGTTETCAFALSSYCTDSEYSRLYTCGRTLDYMECKIVNPETGEECFDMIPGELLIKGYNLMKGYYKCPEATSKAIDKDGWYHTGDMATRESDGLIRITGRYKDIIIRGGENITPSEIEDMILTIDGILQVEVVGLKDEKYGEEIAAFIIADKTCKASDNEIRELIRKNLAHYKVPKYIFYVDDYPKTSSGKIQKYLLVKKGEAILGL